MSATTVDEAVLAYRNGGFGIPENVATEPETPTHADEGEQSGRFNVVRAFMLAVVPVFLLFFVVFAGAVVLTVLSLLPHPIANVDHHTTGSGFARFYD